MTEQVTCSCGLYNHINDGQDRVYSWYNGTDECGFPSGEDGFCYKCGDKLYGAGKIERRDIVVSKSYDIAHLKRLHFETQEVLNIILGQTDYKLIGYIGDTWYLETKFGEPAEVKIEWEIQEA